MDIGDAWNVLPAMSETITPPGKARIVPCPECKGV
jgi:hypothetical protein